MVRIDENQEAVAQIRTAVNAADAIATAQAGEQITNAKLQLTDLRMHWRLGAPQKRTNSMNLQKTNLGNPIFQNFHKRLITWLKFVFPNENITGLPMTVRKDVSLVILI